MAKRKTIIVPFESFMFLRRKMRNERIENPKPFSEQYIKRIRNEFAFEGNKRMLYDGSLGGCNGSPVNAYEEGRWTSWSISEMARMLDEAGLPWEEGPEQEYIIL